MEEERWIRGVLRRPGGGSMKLMSFAGNLVPLSCFSSYGFMMNTENPSLLASFPLKLPCLLWLLARLLACLPFLFNDDLILRCLLVWMLQCLISGCLNACIFASFPLLLSYQWWLFWDSFNTAFPLFGIWELGCFFFLVAFVNPVRNLIMRVWLVLMLQGSCFDLDVGLGIWMMVVLTGLSV